LKSAPQEDKLCPRRGSRPCLKFDRIGYGSYFFYLEGTGCSTILSCLKTSGWSIFLQQKPNGDAYVGCGPNSRSVFVSLLQRFCFVLPMSASQTGRFHRSSTCTRRSSLIHGTSVSGTWSLAFASLCCAGLS